MAPSFAEATNIARDELVGVKNESKLQLYAHYKQATCGDAPSTGPSRLRAVEHAKWKAWREIAGLATGDAEAAYVDLVEALRTGGNLLPIGAARHGRSVAAASSGRGHPATARPHSRTAKLLVIMGAVTVVASIAWPIVRLLYANQWMCTLALGWCLVAGGVALAVHEEGSSHCSLRLSRGRLTHR